jgi:hypothetical protein
MVFGEYVWHSKTVAFSHMLVTCGGAFRRATPEDAAVASSNQTWGMFPEVEFGLDDEAAGPQSFLTLQW